MSRRLGPRSPHSPLVTALPMNPQNEAASQLFDQFCAANTFQAITSTFNQMCDLLELRPSEHRVFYRQLKARLTSWKAQSLWTKLDKRASHREYKKGSTAANTRVLVIGCGPIGLRTAIEVAFLGAKSVIVEKRDRFSRNNVLHLWPFLIHDLKALGAKKFFGKFCAGAIDHISIRTLQCILLKVALLVGVEVHGGVGFDCLAEPNANESDCYGWRAKVEPSDHPVSEYEFDVLVGADGKRNTLPGFKRKEFRGKLAIAITANFINKNTQLEARVEEISGVAYIFNQKFFKDLNQQTGIDLENIVYYKDETHYFVMTAKKQSLLRKQVLRKDYDDPAKLLSRDNVNQDALMNYAREAADVSTNNLMPNLEFAHNHYGLPDVAMFDFTSMFAAEHASRIIEKNGKKVLVCLVGDSLLEPFWPTGSGCARGFLSALDTAWMVRNYASCKMTPLEVMAERESIYQLLSQTTPENLSKNFNQYTVDPMSRYPNINKHFFKPFQVRHQYEGVDAKQLEEIIQISEQKSKRYEWIRDSHYLLKWFQKQLESYKNLVKIHDLTTSWRNGLAVCALIHKYRPELLDVYSLDINKVAENNQMAFNIAEKEFGIKQVMSGQEMAQTDIPDKLSMASYLSQYYEYFRKESLRPAKMAKTPEGYVIPKVRSVCGPRSPSNRLSVLNKISQRIRQRKVRYVKSITIWSSSSSEDLYLDDGNIDKENEGLKRQRRPGMSHGMAHKKLKEEEESELPPPNTFLKNYRRLEGVDAYKDTKFEEVKKQIKEDQISAAVGIRGQNKVSELAKDLARQFSGEHQIPTEPKKPVPKATKPLIMGHAAPAENCYFCKDKVYLVERNTAEGVYFHRGCLKCDYCSCGLRIGGYSFKRTDEGEAKFYCVQHHGMRRQFVRARKRSFGDKELVQKLLPVLSPEKQPIQGSKQATTPVSQHLLKPPEPATPDTIDGYKNKTPERIEFEPESEYEESELEQTAHNLSSTLLDLSDDDLEDSDSDSEEEEWGLDEEELSDADMSWAELARNYSKQMKKKLSHKQKSEDGYDSDSDTPTIGGSDADYETDTETEDYEEVRLARRAKRVNIPGLSLSPPNKDFTMISPQKDAKSPASEEIHQKRNSFFNTISEPVRIDPWAFLGISKKKDEVLLNTGEQKENAGDFLVEVDGSNNNENISVVDNAQEMSDNEAVDVVCVTDEEKEQISSSINQNNINLSGSAQLESDRKSSDHHLFDMTPTELHERRVERHRRMNKSDNVMSGKAGVRQLEIPVVSLEDGGSTSDTTSLMEGDLTTPDIDVFKMQIKEEIAALPLEMTSFLEEMSSLPQDIISDNIKVPFLENNIPELDMDMIENSDRKVEAIDLDSPNMDVYTEEELIEFGFIKNLSQNDSETLSTSEHSNTDLSVPYQSPKSSVENMQKQFHDTEISSIKNEDKLSFFSVSAKPVRIDAKSFLGLKTTECIIDATTEDDSFPVNEEMNKSNSHSDLSESYSDNNRVSELDETLLKECPRVLNTFESTNNNVINNGSYFEGNSPDTFQSDKLDYEKLQTSNECDIENFSSVKTDLLNIQSEQQTIDDVINSSVLESVTETSNLNSQFDNTESLVCDNYAAINDTQCEDLSDLVATNIKEFSEDTILNDESLVTMKENMQSLETNTEVSSDNNSFAIVDDVIKTTEKVADTKSSSDESDKYDTIKRKRGLNKTPLKELSYQKDKPENILDINSEKQGKQQMEINVVKQAELKEEEQSNNPFKTSSSFHSQGSEPLKTSSSFQSEGSDPLKTSTSFYSEGNGSRISSIPDNAPLASLDLEMDITSGTDTEYERTKKLERNTVETESSSSVDNVFHQESDETLEDNIDSPKKSTICGNTETRRKSDVEKEAIKRIDDILLCFEQSKETKIDFPLEENRISETEKSDSIDKWLEETTNVSILEPKPQLDETNSSKNKSKWDQSGDSSLPYVSFGNDDSSQYDSFGTPNAAFISSPSDFNESLQEISETRNVLKEMDPSENDISLSCSQSAPEKLNNSVIVEKGNNLNDSSIIEFKVSGDEGNQSFSVDEKYVVTRDRRKKKMKTSHSESSTFTISTPSESIASTSSVPELLSTLPSSVALTASTTGDSFSAVKGPAFKLTAEDINSSFNDIALNYQKESSVSLENLLSNNKDIKESANECSSLDIVVDNNLNNIVETKSEILTSDLVKTAQSNDTSVVRSSLDSISDVNILDNVCIVSKSAPTSVHSVKKLTGSFKSLQSPIENGVTNRFFSSPKHLTSNDSMKDSSFYFTPNISGVEPMDTSEGKHDTPKSPAPTVKSDSMLIDDRRNELRKSDAHERSESPVNNIMDAKRKFFCETPKPVRIDHFKLFEKDRSKGANDAKALQKGWKSLDSPSSIIISAGVPNSNIATGNSDGLFYTPAMSVKSKPYQNGTDDEDTTFRKQQDVNRKYDADSSTRSGLSVARELTTEERRRLFDEKRDKARQEARDRAKLMSDEELGIHKYTPVKGILRNETSDSESGKLSVASGGNVKSKPAPDRPISAKSYFKQSSRDSIESSERKTDGSEPSPSSDRKEKLKNTKGLFKSQKASPKMDKKQKKKKEEDEKENKDIEVLKKEKKRSLLSKFLPSKGQDKKDKQSKSNPVSPPLLPNQDKEKKQTGVIFRSRRSKSADRSGKTKSQTSEEDSQAKRESLYRELAPMFEHVLGKPDGDHAVSAVKAKIETVAPAPSKAPYTALDPPKAAGEDFDTESEFGDTTSVRSFQGSSAVSGLSEEELAKLIKKQQKAAKKRQREQELRRLHMAQEIQRQLEEVEVKQREIEQKGVIIERALRGEGPDAKRDESELMQDWFNIVHEKNVLVRYESELMVHARELELEDRQSRLEQQLRDRMSIDENENRNKV